MEVLAIIAAISKVVGVIQAISDAAPAAVETIEAGQKAYDLIKKVVTKDPNQVTQEELDELNAMAEQLENDIINDGDDETTGT